MENLEENVFFSQIQEKYNEIINKYQIEINKLRTGSPSPLSLHGILVECYGSNMPIENIANIFKSESTQLTIKPYDISNTQLIIKSLYKYNKNLNIINFEKLIRINYPLLSEEVRKTIVKDLHLLNEKYRIQVRNERRNFNHEVEKIEHIGNDKIKDLKEKIQNWTDKYITKIDEISVIKENEIFKV